jgi:hypothetical protein
MPHAPRAETKLVYLTNTMSDDGKTIKTVTATEDTEAMPHEDYAHRQDRDRHIAPLCVPDLRALVLEPRNPQLYPDGPVTWTDIRNDRDIQHDAVLLSYLDRLDTNLRDMLLKKVPSRNQLLVTVHPVVCGILGANIANVFNGATTQAKSTLYYTVRNRSLAPLYLTIHLACIHSLLCSFPIHSYMHKIKYLTKNAVALANSISVMHAVMTHLDKNVSTAGDAQTDPIMRQVKTMVERYYNSLNTLQEIGLQQAVASIFGQGSWSSTEQFTYCYIKPALAYVRGLLSSSSYVSDDNGLSEDADDSTNEYEDDISSDNGVDRDDTSAEVAGPDDGEGSSFIYTTNSVSTGQKELVATPQHIHYALRGAFLGMLNLNEYVSCVEVVLRPSWSQRPALPISLLDDGATCPGNGETIEEANENEDGDGTPLSTTVKRRERHSIYNFDCRHPLYQTHVQRLRAKQLTTIKAGARPPKYPGRRKKGRSTHWTAVAHSFAEYVLVLYKPWNYDDLVLNRLRLSWRALGDWIHHDLDPPYPDYLTRYRKETTFSTIPDNGTTMQTSETRISDVARVLRNKPPNGESPKELPQNATPIIATPYIQR